MDPETGAPAPTAGTPAPTPTGGATPTPSNDTPSDKMVPESALVGLRKDLQAKLAAERAKVEKYEADQAEAERLAAEKTGEFERLYQETKAERDGLKAKVTELSTYREQVETRMEERRQVRIAALGEEWAAIIPESVTGAALDSLLDGLEARKAAASTATPAAPAPKVPVIPGGNGGSDGSTATTVVSEAETAWMRDNKPSWLAAPRPRQRSLLDKFGPKGPPVK
jgi:hypothetical protein